jgi:hypothetical protein
MRYLQFTRTICLLVITVASFFMARNALACNDPAKHPGMAEYNALIESFEDQPRGAVQLMYKLGDIRLKGIPVSVSLNFWPIRSYTAGQLVVSPSDGLELVDYPGTSAIPYKGSLDFHVMPIRSGFHYLKIEMITQEGQEETRNLGAIAVSVDGSDDIGMGREGENRFGFAGPRFKKHIGEPAQSGAD